MGKNTSIEWCDHSWPVLNGCRRKSAGCVNCYAERLTATRLRHLPKYAGLAVYTAGGPRWTGASRLWKSDLAMPFRIRKPSRIFVADMGDLFFEENSFEDIAAVFGVMAACSQHTFQVLTKRPERAAEWSRWLETEAVDEGSGRFVYRAEACRREALEHFPAVLDGSTPPALRERRTLMGYDQRWPLPNVHLGVSVESQPTADERIPLLRKLPAALRFVSAEPLLASVDLSQWLSGSTQLHCCMDVAGAIRNRSFDGLQKEGKSLSRVEAKAELERILKTGVRVVPISDECNNFDDQDGCQGHRQPGIDWVVTGGESGPGARPCALEWLERIVDQCRDAGVPAFVKQLGAYVVSEQRAFLREDLTLGTDEEAHAFGFGSRWLWRAGLADKKGGDMAAWPETLRVRQLPQNRETKSRLDA